MGTLFTRWIPTRQVPRGTGQNGEILSGCIRRPRRGQRYMLVVTVTLLSLVAIPLFIVLPLRTDTPDLPDPFDNVLSLYGIYRAYQQQEDSGMAQQYYVAFVGELDNLTARYKSTPAPQPVILNSRRASRWLSQAILPNRLRYSWE